ncbi:hypothetical protein PN498_14515 [Oscillatoria sp. CS-180]|uniref:hypothetical protein n=1 Tax=Oscillatoria sp. CS-180 TaxID=3021720 RepID=UPI00232D60A3|nr:hypothetical protein [Oscillatoria sp. CS-180]MDB9527211.1 hypothetical protein [Oscillatoria sp. CS-180]
MELKIRKYLYEIQQACQLVTDFTKEQIFASYQANPSPKGLKPILFEWAILGSNQ